MGLFMNIITFGAAARIEKKVKEYNQFLETHQRLNDELKRKSISLNKTLVELIKTKLKAVKSLNKMKKLEKNFNTNGKSFEREKIGNQHQTISFNKINNTLTTAYAAIGTAGGLSAGIGTAVGAWALVSTVGVASTGTFIGTLSGVAATNATLAWFGGGALAAGGGGIAAGITVLGWLFFLPLIVVTGIMSHILADKKIDKLEKEIVNLQEMIVKTEAKLTQLNSYYDQTMENSNQLIFTLGEHRVEFDKLYKIVYKEIYRIFVLSRLVKWSRLYILRKNYYSSQDLELLSQIVHSANHLAELIDTKVLNEEMIN
jgi:hypothetical protein